MSKARVLIMAALVSNLAAASELREVYERSRGGAFKLAAEHDVTAAGELFAETLRNAGAEQLGMKWQRLGFHLQPLKREGVYLLVEMSERKEGRGLYAFAPETAMPLLLQAPHVPTDEKTGLICVELFESGKVRAAAWNTVSRRSRIEGSNTLADLARLPGTHFEAFSLAFSKVHPNGKLVQLHGFESSNHVEKATSDAAFIISHGTANPSLWHAQLAKSLSTLGLGPALLYPRDTRALGGTRNVIGQSLRKAGFEGFVHLEMSRPTRTKLLDTPGLQDEFLNALKDP